MSTGSMPLPADFDIRLPLPSWITGWMKTSRNGTSPRVEQAEDHHPGDPEGDDVAGRREDARRVILRQLGRLLGPAEGRVRPEGRAEPGVEDVGVLDQRRCPGRARRRRGRPRRRSSQPPDSAWRQATSSRPAKARSRSASVGVVAVPDRDPVAPPELPADAPVALLAEPVEVALGVALGVDRDPARGHGVHRVLRPARPSGRTTGPTGTARSASCSGRSS